MSIAGMICMARVLRREATPACLRQAKRNCVGPGASVPSDEVGKQLKSGAVAFLRMELHGKDISLRYCASKRRWIRCCPRPDLRGGRRRIIAVREIEARRVGNFRPERMRLRL